MRIIDLDDAHHQGHSCASSEQIMRINGNDDAGDVNRAAAREASRQVVAVAMAARMVI
jgi:hypothetical protein